MTSNDMTYLNDVDRVRKRRRKKRRRGRRILAAIMLFVLTLAIIGGIVWAIVYFVSNSSSVAGNYERSVDITSQIASDMAIRLSDVDGVEIDAGWVRERIENCEVTEVLALQSDKTFTRSIDQNSYTKLTQTINQNMDTLLSEIIAQRLTQEGYSESVSRDEAASITRDVLGMSAKDYLETNGVVVAPSMDEISEMVIGTPENQSGSYKVSGGKITLTVNGIDREETLIKKKGVLVFTDSSRVYNEK